MNPYFIPISFDLDNSNPALYNMNQQHTSDWIYPTQHNTYPQSYDKNFQNNFHSSQSRWGFTSLEPNFQSPYPQSFLKFALYTPFLEPPTEENSN